MSEIGVIETGSKHDQTQVNKHPHITDEDGTGTKEEIPDNSEAETIAKARNTLKDLSLESPSENAEKENPEGTSIDIPKEAIAPNTGPLTKVKELFLGVRAKDMEKIVRLYYPQEQLLQLVKEAESEGEKIRRSNSRTKNLSTESNQSDIDSPIDIGAINEELLQLGIDLETNELNFSDLISKENRGEKLTDDEISALKQIWEKRADLENKLATAQSKQNAYPDLMKRKSITDFLDRSLKKAWKSFNARSDVNSPLSKLQSIALFKANMLGLTDFSISERTSPSEIAGKITQFQMDSRKPFTQSTVALAA